MKSRIRITLQTLLKSGISQREIERVTRVVARLSVGLTRVT
jgi:hypothetical protein